MAGAEVIGQRLIETHLTLMQLDAGGSLLVRAQKDGAVPGDVAIEDLLKLVNGICLASDPDTDQADRLLDLAIRGVAPGRDE